MLNFEVFGKGENAITVRELRGSMLTFADDSCLIFIDGPGGKKGVFLVEGAVPGSQAVEAKARFVKMVAKKERAAMSETEKEAFKAAFASTFSDD